MAVGLTATRATSTPDIDTTRDATGRSTQSFVDDLRPLLRAFHARGGVGYPIEISEAQLTKAVHDPNQFIATVSKTGNLMGYVWGILYPGFAFLYQCYCTDPSAAKHLNQLWEQWVLEHGVNVIRGVTTRRWLRAAWTRWGYRVTHFSLEKVL